MKRDRVLLVCPPYPGYGDDSHFVPNIGASVTTAEPLALEYVAAAVKDICDLRLIDLRLEGGFKGLQTTLEEFQPHVVGVTWMASLSTYDCRRVVRMAKDFDERILTVVGGSAAMVSYEDALNSDIDVVVLGEGTLTFREIVRTFQKGGELRDIKGIVLRDGDSLHTTPPRGRPDLSALPLADRSINAHLRQHYRSKLSFPPTFSEPFALLRASWGCLSRCDFCAGWVITGGNRFEMDEELVVQELIETKEENITWADGDTWQNPEKSLRLAQLIKKAGIKKKYKLGTRTDDIVSNPHLVEAWKEVGLEGIFLGIEGHTDAELQAMHKGTSMGTNAEAIQLLKEYEVQIATSFIVDPTYDKKDFEDLASYAISLDPDYTIFSINTPLPGTQHFARTKHQFTVHNWVFWDLGHAVLPTKLPLDEFYHEYGNLYTTVWMNNASFMRKLAEDTDGAVLQAASEFVVRENELFEHHALYGEDGTDSWKNPTALTPKSVMQVLFGKDP